MALVNLFFGEEEGDQKNIVEKGILECKKLNDKKEKYWCGCVKEYFVFTTHGNFSVETKQHDAEEKTTEKGTKLICHVKHIIKNITYKTI